MPLTTGAVALRTQVVCPLVSVPSLIAVSGGNDSPELNAGMKRDTGTASIWRDEVRVELLCEVGGRIRTNEGTQREEESKDKAGMLEHDERRSTQKCERRKGRTGRTGRKRMKLACVGS